MRIMHVASEVAPFAKTGGLADVLGALPSALARQGADVTVVAPRYKSIDPAQFGLARWLRTIEVPLGHEVVPVGIYEGQPPGGAKVRLLLIDHPPSFGRDGIYGDQAGEFGDNPRRFTILGRAALTVAAQMNLWPDVLHGHDWQAGPTLLYARGAGGDLRPPKMVFTIHNLAYQGNFGPEIIDSLGLPRDLWHPGGYEFYGNVSLLKAGIVVADRVTTVSPTYAKEIQTPDQGWGLDGLLRSLGERLVGILNGVDYDVWSPERDRHLPQPYSAEEPRGKALAKALLQRELGLPQKPDVPLFGVVSRLAYQKGMDLLLDTLPELLAGDVQLGVLGAGEQPIESAFRDAEAKHKGKLSVRLGYDDRLAHLIEAGADFFVMPSRYEPCGLNQMYSLRYGTPPIVRSTGGLEDTIVDHEPRSRTGTGFKFEGWGKDALWGALARALAVYRNPDELRALQRRGMAQDFSWNAAARRYLELYERIQR
jgi:starch synthase